MLLTNYRICIVPAELFVFKHDMKYNHHIFVLFLIFMLPNPVSAAGCKFDQGFIGKIKRALKKTPTEEVSGLTNISIIPDEQYRDMPFNGFVVKNKSDSAAKGYILAIPGNAQRASTIINNVQSLANLGFDVFSFNYRGLLEGKKVPRIEGLINDTRKLVAYLNSRPEYKNKRHIIYGVSSGGIFALQALDILSSGDNVILDAVPDELSIFLWCDSSVHPKNAILAAKKFKIHVDIIHGAEDPKVVPLNSYSLISTIESLHGKSIVIPTGYHPYEEKDDVSARLKELEKLLGEKPNG